MSDKFDDLFETLFGEGGPLRSLFKDGKPHVIRRSFVSDKKRDERDRYQESLMTELLTTLAGKGVITNADARDLIGRARERAKKKDGEDTPTEASEKASSNSDAPCGGTCELHDERPHKTLSCRRCKEPVAHLIEGEVARCRACLTVRMVS